MLSTPRFVASAILGLGLATACSSTTDSTAPSSVDVKTYASVQCDYFDRCEPFVLSNVFGTKDTCTTSVAASLAPQLALKGVSISEAQTTACQTQEAAQTCDDPSTPAACQFKGTLPNDTACAVDLQCASGNCYFATDANGATTACGTCKDFVAEGADCSNGQCESGLSCNGTTNKCTKGGAEGAACTDGSDCGGSLPCVSDKCTKLLAEGAACNPSDTNAVPCDAFQNLYCKAAVGNTTTGVCSKLVFANLGQPCGLDKTTNVFTACSASRCVVSATDITQSSGTCTAPLAAGADCSTAPTGCAFGLKCIAGVCGVPNLASCNP